MVPVRSCLAAASLCLLASTPAVAFGPSRSAAAAAAAAAGTSLSGPTSPTSSTSTQLASSYLDSLEGASTSLPAGTAPSWAAAAAPASPAAATSSNDIGSGSGFAHASLDYFALPNLAGKGARATADWGTPADATRGLADDGLLRSGAWYCTEGGWPSPSPKAHTEIFYVLDGHGALGDADGVLHRFGPGDTVTIPKGHTGRWDVYSPIHKVWAVNAHDRIEETVTPIRTQVDHYAGCAPQCLDVGVDALYGTNGGAATVSSKTLYDVGPTRVGYWAASPGSLAVGAAATAQPQQPRTFFFVLEGVLFVTDGATGASQRCVAGDTVQLPRGWSGTIDVVEPVRKMYTLAD